MQVSFSKFVIVFLMKSFCCPLCCNFRLA